MALRSPLTLQPYDYISDSTGRPLDKGQIYIGVAGQDPEFYQIPVFLDAEMTKPIDQPIRTNDGFVDFAGSLSELYASGEIYSVKMLDKEGRTVLYKGDMTRKNLMSDALADLNQSIVDAQSAAQAAIDDTVNNASIVITNVSTDATAAIDNAVLISNDAASRADSAIQDLFESGGLPARPFETYAKMTAPDVDPPLVDGDYAVVTNDDDLIKNGNYIKENGAWVYIKYNPVSSKIISVDGVSIAITDAENNQTWLQASSNDGGLTPVAEQAIRDKINVYTADSTLMYAVTDGDNNLTELQVDNAGLVPDEVLNAWSQRMGVPDDITPNNYDVLDIDLPVMAASQTTINPHDTYYKNGELLPLLPDVKKVIYTGSSSAFKSKDYLETALKAINPSIDIYTPAMSGGVIGHMQTLVGDKPMRLNFTDNKINKTGGSTANATEANRFRDAMGVVTGWVDGIKGSISAVRATITFTRDVASSVDTIVPQGVEFIPEKGYEYRNAIQIIWIGKNNLVNASAEYNNVDNLIKNTNSMIEFNASMVKRTIVMTHFIDTNVPAVSDERERIERCNRLYKLHYKQNVFDVIPFLTGEQIFTDLAITRTADDITKQEMGNVPASLAADAVHLKPAVYEYLMSKLVDFIVSKNYLEV